MEIKYKMKIVLWAFLLAMVASFGAFAQTDSDSVDIVASTASRRFSFTEKRTAIWENDRPLDISEEMGSIIIRGKKGKEISVKAIKTAYADALSLARGAAAEIGISIDIPRDKVKIRTDVGQVSEKHLYAYADYSLRIPPEMSVRAETMEGEVLVSGLDGEVEIMTSSGPVRVSELKGKVSVKTDSGNIQVKKSPGVYNVETDGGDVKIYVPEEGMTDDLLITSGSGDVDITLPVGVTATIVADVGGGRIINDAEEIIVPVSLNSAGGGEKKIFRSGEGGKNIKIESGTGTIHFATINPPRPVIVRPAPAE